MSWSHYELGHLTSAVIVYETCKRSNVIRVKADTKVRPRLDQGGQVTKDREGRRFVHVMSLLIFFVINLRKSYVFMINKLPNVCHQWHVHYYSVVYVTNDGYFEFMSQTMLYHAYYEGTLYFNNLYKHPYIVWFTVLS